MPESYFHGPSYRYIVDWLEHSHSIYAVLDIPHNTFRPHCNAKTLAVFVQKGMAPPEHVLFAVADEFGHNHQGKPVYRFDPVTQEATTELWDDTERIMAELTDPDADSNEYVFRVPRSSIVDQVYVPSLYNGIRKEAGQFKDTSETTYVTFRQLVDDGIVEVFRGHGSPEAKWKGRGEVPYVRAADIINWSVYKNPTTFIPVAEYERLMKSKRPLQMHDIIFVKEGSYRIGDVAMVGPDDTVGYLNSHCLVFRVTDTENEFGITPFYLLYLLSQPETRAQIKTRVCIDTTLPNVGTRYLDVRLPVHRDKAERQRLTDEIGRACQMRWEAAKIQERVSRSVLCEER